MAVNKNVGVYTLPNGNWEYRFVKTVNGKRKNYKSTKDELGNPLTSQKAAIRAREIAMIRAEAELNRKPKVGSLPLFFVHYKTR